MTGPSLTGAFDTPSRRRTIGFIPAVLATYEAAALLSGRPTITELWRVARRHPLGGCLLGALTVYTLYHLWLEDGR